MDRRILMGSDSFLRPNPILSQRGLNPKKCFLKVKTNEREPSNRNLFVYGPSLDPPDRVAYCAMTKGKGGR